MLITKVLVAKIYTNKGFEFVSEYKIVRSFLKCMPVLILSSVSTNTVPKKRDCKESAIIVGNPGCVKIVFALFAKPVVIQV